jgi:dTMP kinase
VLRIASERRARAHELALEEAALSESLAEQRTLEAAQRAQAVKSMFARRLLRQEERHAELRVSVSLGTLSTSSSGDKVETQIALQKQSEDAAAAEVQKRAAITAERQRKETQLLAKAQELKRRRDEAARRNEARRQAINDATAAAAAAHSQRREAGSAEAATRLLAKRDHLTEEHSRLRAELNTAAGVRRHLADSAADMETRRLADLLLSEQTLAARKQVQAAAEQGAAARQRERQAQAQLAHAALAFEAKRSMAERYEHNMHARRQEASEAKAVEQQRKRDLVLAARQHAAQVRDQRKTAVH